MEVPPRNKSIIAFLFAVVLLVLVAISITQQNPHSSNATLRESRNDLPEFSCTKEGVVKGDEEFNAEHYFYTEKNTILTGDANFSDFRDKKVDGWRESYEERKVRKTDWKLKAFGDNLTGDGNEKIYESACGLGMNIMMTLELLAEHRDIHSLTVYGSDYIPESAIYASKFIASQAPSGTKVGTFCPSDSTNLSHLPENSFDLVFTGYIDPIVDPFSIGVGDDDGWYDLICNADTEIAKKMSAKSQRLQEDWYAQWVIEMIRIAKPGKPVIIEEVSNPLCSADGDWGGVTKEWWTSTAISRYSWDVDPLSFFFPRCEKEW
eukprot:CAMPEP_0197837980 /NCGR_PEP_ID=MMETSP1437-20131217/33953_1 /TAXON_ID=49252 ORGANISM="Eucampia antarctica, Strain CCMP1452" /NCGR_SAMPLE_ID=MMETSP1437 /ASSEMBLY_ACC=CAM_ASM_001096 /LENGTH=319 /DNA_ID=CAMNT_0043445475 /DNA_START=36 /DNA_END=995 /DNA_ORIENTATION=-